MVELGEQSWLQYLFLCFCRYPDGQSRLVPAVCYLNLFLSGHESSGSSFWLAVGLPEQHGELHGVYVGHLPVQKHGLDHGHGGSHWLCVRHAADIALHTHLSLPQGEGGKEQGFFFVFFMQCSIILGHDIDSLFSSGLHAKKEN